MNFSLVMIEVLVIKLSLILNIKLDLKYNF